MPLRWKSIKLKHTDEELSKGFLKGNQYIEELIILDGFKEIPEMAFCNCPNLKKVEIHGESVKKIGNSAFYECENLVDVKLNEVLEEIDVCAFAYCKKLPKIEIPNSVKRIGYSAFLRCEHLVDVKLKEGLEEIDDWAFAYCKKLPKIEIPKSVKRIGNNAFDVCENLQTIDIDNTETFVKTNWDTTWLEGCKATVNYLRR
jgi:hypothetical protein